MYDGITLKGLVRAKFRSTRELADLLKWSYSKTYRIIAGQQDADVNDIRQLSIALGLDTPDQIVSVFSLL